MVHSGFKASAAAVNRRVKELLVAACAGEPRDWDLLVTGHSLGGALATLMATEIAESVDTSRGFKMAKDDSLWSKAAEFVTKMAPTSGYHLKLANLSEVECLMILATLMNN